MEEPLSAKLFLYLAAGGITGTLARYLIGGWFQQASSTFPWGTLVINLVGSFVLGFLMRYLLGSSLATPELRAGLTIGFCGAFTTMSTFAYESVTLLSDGQYARAGVYVLASAGGSIVAAFGGLAAAARIL